jgi:HAD superfamily hydrolase (TIGR01509 family)
VPSRSASFESPQVDDAAMKSYILWDHDGVLVDTERWYFEATKQAIQALGINLSQREYLFNMAAGRSAWEIAKLQGATEEEVERQRAIRDRLYQRFLLDNDIEIPGVIEVLAQLSPAYKMAIVTTAKRADFDLIHQSRAIVDHMTFVLVKGDYVRSKPAPDPYLAALERFGAQPHEAIVVEDSERGLRAAVAAGIDCVVVANEFVAEQDLSSATHRIESIWQLPALLKDL